MNILTVGDIFSSCGVRHTEQVLREIIYDEKIDLCIANGENASGSGMTYKDYNDLTDAGVDVFTMGNHTFGKKDILKIFESETNVIRPLNYPDSTPGKGSVIIGKGKTKVGVINIMGRVNISLPLDCPFKAAKNEIEKIKDRCDIIMVDFHAEATSEKRAMLFYLDGCVSAVYGTHTHVQTADETVTGRGTGYITDIGMTGCIDSCLGVSKDIIIERFTSANHKKFEYPEGKAMLCGAVFSIDESTGKCAGVKRIKVL